MARSAGWLVSNFALIIIKQCLTSLHHMLHVPPSVTSAKIIREQITTGKCAAEEGGLAAAYASAVCFIICSRFLVVLFLHR